MIRFPSAPGTRQRGFALIAAIFIVVVLAVLGIMMITISGTQRATASAAVLGARAYHAARTGVEWGIYGALNNTVATCGGAPSTPTTNNFNLAVNGLNGYAVTVVCRYTEHRERSDPYNVYVINATATFGAFGSDGYVSRTLRTTVTSAPP